MKFQHIAIVVLVGIIYEAQCQRTLLELFIGKTRILRTAGLNLVGRTASNARSLNNLQLNKRLQRQIDINTPFLCNVNGMRSPERPTNVNQLRPGDIDVIGALGDSLTAGNGAAASTILEVYTENRGISWSMGGQGTWRSFLTIPNILKEFNPKLIGYSLSDSLSIHKESQFNVAEPVAMSRDLLYMSKQLIKRIRNDPRVDFENDWKLVNILIGPNDFCADMCFTNHPEKFPELRRRRLEKTLRNLRDNMPRTFVNLVMVPHLKVLLELKNRPQQCVITHYIECPCLFGIALRPQHAKFFEIMEQSQEVDVEIASRQEFNTEDFAVTLQPFSKNVFIPDDENNSTDYSYLSADCFHFSQKTHALVANALWNNMLEPVGNKTMIWLEQKPRFLCPNEEHPYIYTAKNSGVRLFH